MTVKKKETVLIVLLFVLMEIIAFLFIYSGYSQEKNHHRITIETNLKNLFEGAFLGYENTAAMIFENVVNNPEVLKRFNTAYTNPALRNQSRNELYHIVSKKYTEQKKLGLRQFHFHFKDGTSFLRVHSPGKFGDYLFDKRYSLKIANEEKKRVSGFEEGHFADGFRYIFPLSYADRHLGTVEIDITAGGIIEYISRVMPGNYYFTIKKDTVMNITYDNWRQANYKPSDFSTEFVVDKSYYDEEIVKQLNQILAPKIKNTLMEFESFSKSVKYSKENYAVVFLPIKNISGDSVAWLVQYNKDDFFHKNVSSFLINLSSVTILIWILFIIFRKMRDQKLQLESLNRDLESNVKERTTELENVVKELEDFNYNIAHDLRTPLRAMNGFSRILLSEYGEKIDDEGKRLLNVISGNAVRMGKLIDGILYFSQLRRMKKTCVTIDMNSLTREVWNELQFLEIEIGRKVDFKLLDMQPLYADPGMIRQAIKNLISNAIKFTRDRDMAQIEAGSIMQNNEVVYFVKDNGCGFDMQYYQRLFGVFSRLHGIEEYEGTGIGLAVVKRIILKHNGKVWADGKLDKGATFYFSLPVGLDKVDH